MKQNMEQPSCKWNLLRLVILICTTLVSTLSFAQGPGIAPVNPPIGGMNLDGYLQRQGAAGDWCKGLAAGLQGAGTYFFNDDGTKASPYNGAAYSGKVFLLRDPFDVNEDEQFTSGAKLNDDPNDWQWRYGSGKVLGKDDIHNAMFVITENPVPDGLGRNHVWVLMAGDRRSTNGTSYLDFEFFQAPVFRTGNLTDGSGGFTSAGLVAGRTIGDLSVTLSFVGGGNSVNIKMLRWQNVSEGVFDYVEITPGPGTAYADFNDVEVNVPFGAFGGTTYGPNQFVEGAIDVTALIGGQTDCNLNFKTLFIKTKSSASNTAELKDFIDPLQINFCLDETAPTITSGGSGGPALGCNPSSSDINNALGTATATDNCTTPTVTATDTDGSTTGCSRTRTRKFTATDACGNTSTASRSVNWTADNTPPSITSGGTGPALGCNPSAGDINSALGTASASDACGAPTLQQSDGSVSSDGCSRSQTRKWTARDACGNTSTASRTATWTADVTPPSFTGSYATVPLGCNPAASDITGALDGATATDACGPTTISQSDGSVGSDGCLRSQARTFTARDGCGNTATISRTVTWTADNTPPVITTGGTTLTLGCNPAASDINNALGTATASDACGVPSLSSSDGSVSSSSCGRSQTRTWTSRDACGNTSTAARTVTWTSDNTPPSFTGNYSNVPLGCNPAASDINNALDGATAGESCGAPTISQSDGNVGSDGCLRSQTRTFTARDACGNTATISRTATWTADVTPPGFTGSYATVPLGCNPAASDITGALDGATATDACGPTTISQSDGSVQSNGCARSQTRTFTARDGCGNTATIGRTVTWTADNTPPAFTGDYSDVVLGCNPADPGGSLGGASASDACGAPTITFSDGSVGSNGCLRSQTRTFTARDACNNTSSVSRTVRWTSDVTPPAFTGSYATVPLGCNPAASDITAALDGAGATDGCSAPTISQSDGSVSSDGCSRSQTRTFTARDGCGNTATVGRTVTWTADNTPPVITTGGNNPSLGCNPSAGDINLALGTATASDACGAPTLSSSDGSVVSTNCGRSQTRKWTARDACGNTSTASRTATWTSDNTGPVFTVCPSSFTSACGVTPEFGTPTATDACSTPTVVAVGDVSSSGSCPTVYTKRWRATDACGNTSTCSQTITVPCCSANCTYTQGKYGQDQDVSDACDGTTSSNNPYSPSQLIEHDLLAYGGLLRIGCVGHSVTIATGEASCVLAMLPGGGSSGPLSAGDYSICALPASYIGNNGRINNALLAQTITLGLNLGINPGGGLGNFALEVNKWLVTADLVECGSTTVKACTFNCTPNLAIPGQYIWTVATTPYHVTDCRISQALYNALPTKNVAGLYAFANSALCGTALPTGVSYSDITNAVDCINNAFDQCRATIGWFTNKPTAESFCTLPSATTPCPPPVTRINTQPSAEVTATGLTVSAFPNPFRDKVRFVISSQVSGQGSLQVYNMLGQRVATVYEGTVVAGRSQIVEYNASQRLSGGMIYTFRVGNKQVTGKLMNIEK